MSSYINIVKKPLILYHFLNNISDVLYDKIFSYIDKDEYFYTINILKYQAREILIHMHPTMYIYNINIINLSKNDIYYIIINYCGYPFIYKSYNNLIKLSYNNNIQQYYHKFCTNNLLNLRKNIKSINFIPKPNNINKIRKKERLSIKNDLYDDINTEIILLSPF